MAKPPAPDPQTPRPSSRRTALANRQAARSPGDAKPSIAPTPAPTAPGPARSGRLAFLMATVVALAFIGVATSVSSQGNPNDGDVKTHRDEAMDPPTQDNPHVDCDGFWVEGFNMEDDFGHIAIFSWEPTGDGSMVVDDTWEADDGTPAHHFLNGPYTLDAGHYRLEVSNGEVEPGQMKIKMFWVDPCDETPEEPEEPLECPSDLQATPNQDGSIRLEWTPAEGSDGTNVYREGEYVTTVTGDDYVDESTVAGESYVFAVSALFGDQESTRCRIEVTAIPEFPTSLGIALASAGGLAALAFASRRRKD